MYILSLYKERFKNHTEIISNNQIAIKEENKKVLTDILSAIILLLVPLFFVTLMIEPSRCLWVFFAFLLVLAYIILKKIDTITQRRNSTAICYAIWTIFYFISAYIGIISNPDSPVVILCAFFTITPLIILDNPKNIIFFVTVLYIITIILVFIQKDASGIITNDIINCTFCFVAGILIGQAVTDTGLKKIQLTQELLEREHTDFLTKLPNRRKLFECFEEKSNIYGIIMLDIDDFKKYNDTYGHQKGDTVLKLLADCLIKTTGTNLDFFRYGGEEFIGLYYGQCNEELREICNTLNKTIRKMDIEHRLTQKGIVSASIGFYFSLEPVKNEAEIDYSDIALYQAKAQGKDCTVSYEEIKKKVTADKEVSFRVDKRN